MTFNDTLTHSNVLSGPQQRPALPGTDRCDPIATSGSASGCGADPLDAHPHFSALLDRLHVVQAADMQLPHPLASQITELKREWTRLALLAHHVPTDSAAAASCVPIHGHLNQIPLLAAKSSSPEQLSKDIKAHVEQGLKTHLVAVVEHGLGQEMPSEAQLSASTHRLLSTLSTLASPPAPHPPPDAATHLAHSLSTTLAHLTSLLATHTSLSHATQASSAYFARVAQVALAKLDLLAATLRAHAAPRTVPLARAVHAALLAKRQALEHERQQIARDTRVYAEMGPEFKDMCGEIRRVRAEARRVRDEVERLKASAPRHV